MVVPYFWPLEFYCYDSKVLLKSNYIKVSKDAHWGFKLDWSHNVLSQKVAQDSNIRKRIVIPVLLGKSAAVMEQFCLYVKQVIRWFIVFTVTCDFSVQHNY